MCPKGHGLPKHFCTECGTAPSASLDLPDDGWCATHNTPEALCLECQKDPGSHDRGAAEGTLAAEACRVPLPIVRLASARLAERVGIETATAVEEEHAHTLVGQRRDGLRRQPLRRHQPARRRASSARSGSTSARSVHAGRGARGRRLGRGQRGQDPVPLGPRRPRARPGDLRADQSARSAGPSRARQELEARTALNQAKASAMDAEQKLRNFGFDDAELARILKEQGHQGPARTSSPRSAGRSSSGTPSGARPSRRRRSSSPSPTPRRCGSGSTSTRATSPRSTLGQPVAFVVSGADDGAATEGEITWVGTEVNERTRTTRVRAEVENAGRPPPGQPVRPGRDPARRRAQGRRRPEGGRPAEGQDATSSSSPRTRGATAPSGSWSGRPTGATSSRSPGASSRASGS